MHSEEIRGKLVAIMRERLAASLRQLPSLAARWPEGPVQPGQMLQASPFVHSLGKQLRTLAQVRTRLPRMHHMYGHNSSSCFPWLPAGPRGPCSQVKHSRRLRSSNRWASSCKRWQRCVCCSKFLTSLPFLAARWPEGPVHPGQMVQASPFVHSLGRQLHTLAQAHTMVFMHQVPGPACNCLLWLPAGQRELCSPVKRSRRLPLSTRWASSCGRWHRCIQS